MTIVAIAVIYSIDCQLSFPYTLTKKHRYGQGTPTNTVMDAGRGDLQKISIYVYLDDKDTSRKFKLGSMNSGTSIVCECMPIAQVSDCQKLKYLDIGMSVQNWICIGDTS